MIFSQVVPSVLAPNVAREVSLLPQLLPSVPAYTLNRACASARPGHHQRRRPDRPRPRRHRSSPAASSRCPTSRSSTRGASAGSWWTRARPRASAAGSAAFGRIRPRDLVPVTPADRRAVHRRDHGPVGREDGEGERHHAARRRTELALHEPPARRRRHRRRAADRRDRALVRRPRRWIEIGRRRQRHPRRHLARGARRSSSRSSTGATARSPPATRRRSPTAPPRCC